MYFHIEEKSKTRKKMNLEFDWMAEELGMKLNKYFLLMINFLSPDESGRWLELILPGKWLSAYSF